MKNLIILYIFIITLSSSCTEPYFIDTEESFEELFVIEATITDVLKTQSIKVSKSIRLDDPQIIPFSGAQVNITDNTGVVYDFIYHTENKVYESTVPFKAEPNKEYHLSVKSNGKNFTASQTLSIVAPLDSLSLKAVTKDGVEGIEIGANSAGTENASPYYRYAYEDVYRAKPPYWSPYYVQLIPATGLNPKTYLVKYDPERYPQVCYPTDISNNFILNSTIDQSNNLIEHFPLKFIDKRNYKIHDRYGIKVTQYASSIEAYNFYQGLNQLAETGDILSPTQPGFVQGNIFNETDSSENVVGFFELVSESTQKVFFSVDDFYTDIISDEYIEPCEIYDLDSNDRCTDTREEDECRLERMVRDGSHLLYEELDAGVFRMVTNTCVDCSVFANSNPPNYWEE